MGVIIDENIKGIVIIPIIPVTMPTYKYNTNSAIT